MDFITRECKLEDYRALARLNQEEMKYDYSAEDTKRRLAQILKDNNHKLYVALSEDEVIGYIHANNHDVIYADPMKNIMGIAVKKEFQGNGIGKRLLQQVEEWGKTTGAAGIRLVSGSGRKGAHAFYRKCGYTEVKEQKNFRKLFK